MRVMFDTNVYDAMASAGDEQRVAALIEAGKITVIVTPVQEAEIRQIRDRAKQQSLLALLRRLGGERIDPAAAIAADIAYLSRDEILARVAETCCELLVTEDKALAAATPRARGYAEFRRVVLQAAG